MIEVDGLTKIYGSRVAVSDLAFRVGKGEIVGFLGPNGAGKTTTLRILAGFLGPTRGRVSIGGHDVMEQPMAARRCLGYMPEDCPAYPELRVAEYLRFRAELKAVPRAGRSAAIDRALGLANLRDRRSTLIGQLSKGYRQRLGLADALLANPPLLILDEPTSGLDPNQIREVREVVRDLAAEHTVLLSTHILAEVEAVCDRALVIHQGKLVGEGSLSELQSRAGVGRGVLIVRPPNREQALPAAVADRLLSQRSLDTGVEELEVSLPEGRASMEHCVRVLCESGFLVSEARLGGVRLEQVFAALTGGATPEA